MENQKELYTESDVKTMRAAEDSRIMGKNRVEELIKFAGNSGYKRIGIAHCISLQREATLLKERLSEKFEVCSIDCKYGKIASSDLLNDETLKGLSCNPAGQADYLADQNTEMNISFGLCMGHDIVFNQKSKVPTTTLIVKDREHKHNSYQEFIKN